MFNENPFNFFFCFTKIYCWLSVGGLRGVFLLLGLLEFNCICSWIVLHSFNYTHLYSFSFFRFLGVKVFLGMRDLQGEFFVFLVFFIALVTDLGGSRVCLFIFH